MHSGKELRCQTNNINADTTGLGKAFAECGTRQRPLGKETAGLLSGTRQSLCRGTRQRKTLGKQKNSRKITKWFLKIGKKYFFLSGRGLVRHTRLHFLHKPWYFLGTSQPVGFELTPSHASCSNHCTTLVFVFNCVTTLYYPIYGLYKNIYLRP